MFSRGFGSRGTPRTFAACERVWNDKAVAVKRYGRVKLGEKTYLHKGNGRYYATFYGNTIVRYYPEYKTIHGCGWEGSPTTQRRITALTGVSMHSNSRPGYKEPVRVGGHPYFAGMRIDNYGYVLAEDQRPDYKEVAKKEVVRQYAALWRKLTKLIASRWAIGEFNEAMLHTSVSREIALFTCERQLIAGPNCWLDTESVTLLLGPVTQRGEALTEIVRAARDALRDTYYTRNDGYETIEVK